MLITVGNNKASSCLFDLLIVLIFLGLILFLGQFLGLWENCRLVLITGIGCGGSDSKDPPEDRESFCPSSCTILDRSSSVTSIKGGGGTPLSSFPEIYFVQGWCMYSFHNCDHFHLDCNHAGWNVNCFCWIPCLSVSCMHPVACVLPLLWYWVYWPLLRW